MPDGQMHEAVWKIVEGDPMIGVAVIDLNGLLLYINEAAAKAYTDRSPGEIIGRRIQKLLPDPALGDEMVENGRRCLEAGRSMELRRVWRGRHHYVTYSPLPCDDEEDDRFLCVVKLGAMPPAGGADLELHTSFIELGPLKELTPRELEVLALIGQGLRVADIAKLLHRSERTIEKHRESIGRKLDSTDRVALALIARRAGLRVDDASLKRIEVQRTDNSKDSPYST
ncbi:MAG: PAS domain-containing protein [Phycisphaerales bacterium]|nr:PAS domain-containing protein [Phycisphaerales bacterium]